MGWRTKYRRPRGTDADVANYTEKLTALMSLNCGHQYEQYECLDYLERHDAVVEAEQRVSWRQERRAAHEAWRRTH